jgi:hypothetical protein
MFTKMQNLIASQDNEWAKPYLVSILKEVNESNGSVSEVFKQGNIIKIMSKISNYVRYDLISKNEVVTYNIPSSLNKDIGCLFS